MNPQSNQLNPASFVDYQFLGITILCFNQVPSHGSENTCILTFTSHGHCVGLSILGLKDQKVGGSTPSPCHCVVSLDKKLYPTLSLYTQMYKWVPGTYCCDKLWDGLASHPEGSCDSPVHFMLRKPELSTSLDELHVSLK